MKKTILVILSIFVSLVIAIGLPKCGSEAEGDTDGRDYMTNTSYSIGYTL